MTIQHLYFLRHAEALHNVRLPHGPTADIPLTEHGFQAVQTIAEKLAAAQIIQPPEMIRVSPLLRTVQTAEGLKPLYPGVPFEMDATLIEWAHFDIPPGRIMTRAEKEPLIDELWRRGDPHWIGNEWGESFHASIERTQRVTEALFADPRDSIVCVSHGHFMQTFVLNLSERMEATAETMTLSRCYERLGNLDIVHIAHDRATANVTVGHYKYLDDYKQAHAYPVKRILEDAAGITLV